MPLKAQQYDAPSNTWLDVMSVTQEVVVNYGSEDSPELLLIPTPEFFTYATAFEVSDVGNLEVALTTYTP